MLVGHEITGTLYTGGYLLPYSTESRNVSTSREVNVLVLRLYPRKACKMLTTNVNYEI